MKDSCFISISKFDSFKNPFATISSLSELHFTCWRFILLVQTKEVISLSYGSSRSSWKPWRWLRRNLIFTMRDIYVNFDMDPPTKFSSSRKSTEFKNILPWNISQMIMNIIPIIMRIVMRFVIKRGIAFWVRRKESQWKRKQKHDQNFLMKGMPL